MDDIALVLYATGPSQHDSKEPRAVSRKKWHRHSKGISIYVTYDRLIFMLESMWLERSIYVEMGSRCLKVISCNLNIRQDGLSQDLVSVFNIMRNWN